MLAIAAGTAVYAIVLSLDASPLTGESNGSVWAAECAGASLIVPVVVMVLAGALAAIAAARRWRVEGRLA